MYLPWAYLMEVLLYAQNEGRTSVPPRMETGLTTLNQNTNLQAQALLMEYRCVLFSEHTVVVVIYVRSLASTYLPCSVALTIDYLCGHAL